MKKNEKEIIQYFYIQDVSITREQAPEQYPAHWHDDAEFTLALKDGCRYRVGDTEYTLKKGDLLLIWPREIHENLEVPRNGCIFVQFSSRLMEYNLDLVAASRFLSSCHFIDHEQRPELAQALTDKIWEIQNLFDSHRPFYETRCKNCIYDMMIRIGEDVMQGQAGQIGEEYYNDASFLRIRSACNYIAGHATEDISQSEVASFVGLSPFYFSKLFRQYLNISFPAYVAGIRLRSAIRLLTNPSLSITEVAFRAGFQSTTAFNKVFHDMMGTSPREYRKMQQQRQA